MNLKGGYKIIDLSSIELTQDAENEEITEPSILEQFNYLIECLEDKNKEVKPVYIRLLDENGIVSVSYARIMKLPEGSNAFFIETIGSFSLSIYIEFEYDSDNEKWILSVATYSYVGLENLVAEEVSHAVEHGTLNLGTKLYAHHYYDDDGNYELWFTCNSSSRLNARTLSDSFKSGKIFNLRCYNDDDIDSNSMVFNTNYSNDTFIVLKSSYDDETASNFDTAIMTHADITPL